MSAPRKREKTKRAFPCPTCGEPTSVFQTIPPTHDPKRGYKELTDDRGIIRIRKCPKGHRIDTIEITRALFDEIYDEDLHAEL